MKTILSILLLTSTSYALDLTANWTYPDDGNQPTGFKIYTSNTPSFASPVEIQDVTDGTSRQITFNYEPTGDVCFGISAYNAWGETSITPGSCLGKPLAVESLSITIELAP